MRRLQTIRPDLGKDIPYNFVEFFLEGGRVLWCEGRGLDLSGAHTSGYNVSGIAVATNADLSSPALNLEPWIPGMREGQNWLRSHFPNMETRVYGHRDLNQTSCPGEGLYKILPRLAMKESEMILLKPEGRDEIFTLNGVHVTDPEELEALRGIPGNTIEIRTLPRSHKFWTTGSFTFPNGLPRKYLEVL